LPSDQRIDFRIGINLGDVIAEEHDIFGDGVNVAARLMLSLDCQAITHGGTGLGAGGW
jgi:hypothetical protein